MINFIPQNNIYFSMKVLKFGGTSVGSAESLKIVKNIIINQTEQVIVVVSAFGGITDLLISTAEMAAKGDAAYLDGFSDIKERHHNIINEIIDIRYQQKLICKLDHLLEELGNIYKGVSLIKDLSCHTLDMIASYGERLSSLIITYMIDGAVCFDARQFIITEQSYGKHIANLKLTNELICQTFNDFNGGIAIVPGFISSDGESGKVSNLGRGGSDYTAALIAAALDASVLEIWTDVDGFMTADPKVIDHAYVIKHLSFSEAMELCNFGAKVVYPPTIYPVYHKNIPIIIKNTFNLQSEGTLISDVSHPDDIKKIKGISSIDDTCLITVSGLGMVGVIGVNSRIFNALSKKGISVFMVSQASSEHNTSFAIRNNDADNAVKALNEEFAAEIKTGEITTIVAEHQLATVAIVGEQMKNTPGIAGKLFNTLGKNGINVIACAQGASETNISFVIKQNNLKKALNVIHDSFFLSPTQVLNLFIVGVGRVGGLLIAQIHSQQARLKSQKSLSLNIVGIANSKHSIFNRDGIDLCNYKKNLDESDSDATPETIANKIIEMNIYNPVFVDCTASAEIAGLYAKLLSNNINVVAANKIAASSDYQSYINLKRIALDKGVKFLFETNVGAGLPIINTINSMINSGDKILKIEAVISGTLNFIFNALNKNVTLSQAIRMAMDAGYSEPDPRLDLSGTDVVRKIVILSREAGYKIETKDVKIDSFIPIDLFKGTLTDFFDNIKKIEPEIESKRETAEKEGKHLRFVACLDKGMVNVGVKEFDYNHPFYSLESSNNVILITTERYKEYPLEIKGYGAGAEVTAAGVFSDIISIANIR